MTEANGDQIRGIQTESERFDAHLRAALSLEIPYFSRAADGLAKTLTGTVRPTRPASVLILLGYPAMEAPESCKGLSDAPHVPHVLITRRTDHIGSHKGQMAFPGGMADPEDPEVTATALRETHEEVGIPPDQVDVLGVLPQLTTLSTGFLVTPVVGMLRSRIHEVELIPSPDEIAEAFWIGLHQLHAPEVYRKEWFRAGPIRLPTHVYQVGPHRIWGATAAMLKNLLDRLEAAKGG